MTQSSLIRHRPGLLSTRAPRELDRPVRWKFLRAGTTFADWAASVITQGWFPPVDFVETDESYVITAELPGLKKKDVTLRLENQVLRISGERQRGQPTEKATFYRSERGCGRFSRSFVLPKALLSEEIDATMRNGILTVTVPKAHQARPHRISVN